MNKTAWIWLPIYVALIGLTLNNTRPYHGDESYYMVSSMQMLNSHNFLLPVYFGEIRFQKPIVAYWITVLGYKLFGVSLWSGRIVFLMLACALLFLIYKFACLLLPDPAFAWLNVFLLSASTLFIEFSRVAMTDLPLTLFTTLGLYYFCHALLHPERLKRAYLFAYIAMGLAFSAKGFLGIFPLVAIVAYLIAMKPPRYATYLRHLLHPLYLIVFALLAFSWYLYAYLAHPNDFIKQFHTESAATFSSNFAPILGNIVFYTVNLFAYYLPFTGMAAYCYLKKRRALPERFRPLLFQIMITLIVLILLIARHKARYLFVTFPALTLVISYILHQHNLSSIAKKIAIIVAFAQVFVFLCYPYVVGEPLQDLIGYWESHLQGELAVYELPERETIWTQVLSHNAVQAYHAAIPYVIIEDKNLSHFANCEIVKEAVQLSKIRFTHGKLTKTFRKFLLIRKI